MRYLYKIASILLPFTLLALSGCGGSGGSSSDPFASSTKTDPAPPTIFGNISTSTGKTGITLTASPGSVDVDSGQVLVTANVVNGGNPVPGVAVTFAIVAPVNGPATFESGLTTVTTNSNGTAITRLATGHTLSTTNVIVSGTVTIGNQTAMAEATFQIVRGTGVIMFTDNAGLTPGGQSNLIAVVSKEVDQSFPAWDFLQLIPFKLTDSNGNPRVNVPVTISVYSITTLRPSDVTVDFLVPPVTEPNQQTITTDSAGQGIFNATVTLTTPPPSGVNIVDVVFKAVTNDVLPVAAYVGASYTLTAKPPAALAITPTTTAFGTTTGVAFTIAGGQKPYHISSSNTARVTATLLADGVTVLAQLVDATDWTTPVVISVTDSAGQSISATVSRQ